MKPLQYVASLTLNGDTGTMDYPTLECGGDVAFVSRSAAGYVYRETLSHGQGCLGGGTITVQPSASSVYWRWDGARRHRERAALPRRRLAAPGASLDRPPAALPARA